MLQLVSFMIIATTIATKHLTLFALKAMFV